MEDGHLMIFSASWLRLPLSAFWASESPNAPAGTAPHRIKIIRIAICLFIIGYIPNCFAREWRGSVSTDVDVPSYLSIEQAELIGVQKLKQIASLEAGEYVRVSESLIDERYQRHIQSINASFISISNIEKSIAVNEGAVKLTLNAEATVDMSLVDERIAYDHRATPKVDIDTKGQANISIPLNHAKFEINKKALVLRRDELGSLSSSSRHFESLGIKHAVDVLNYLMYDGRIASEVIAADFSGDDVSALVKVSYDFNADKLASFFPSSIKFQYREQREHPVFVIFRPALGVKEAVAFYDYLSGHPLVLHLTTSTSTATLPVLYHGNDHFSGCSVGSVNVSDSDVLCIQKISLSEGALNTRFIKNIITISQLRQSLETENEAFNIEAKVSMVAR